jgi:hypothetical protein
LFDDRPRKIKFSRLKMDSGILPCSLFPLRNSCVNEYDEIALICPVNRLFLRYKSSKEGKDNKEGGIVPFSKLSFKYNTVSFGNFENLLSRGPSNLFLEQSNVTS